MMFFYSSVYIEESLYGWVNAHPGNGCPTFPWSVIV